MTYGRIGQARYEVNRFVSGRFYLTLILSFTLHSDRRLPAALGAHQALAHVRVHLLPLVAAMTALHQHLQPLVLPVPVNSFLSHG
jgi:hypothetical protein